MKTENITRPTLELARRKLANYLGMTHDKQFLKMLWAVHALQSKRAADARKYIQYPVGADKYGPGEQWSIYPWEIETLIIELFKTRKTGSKPGQPVRMFAKNNFQTVADPINYLRNIENAESGLRIHQGNIFRELARVVHRQFPWNANFQARERLYFYIYVYGQGNCRTYFHQKYGIAFDQFYLASLYLVTQLSAFPWWYPVPVPGLISNELLQSTLGILSLELDNARKEAVRVSHNGFVSSGVRRTDYQSSFLRDHPIIRSNELKGAICAPLPGLIGYRITAGLFYDFVGNDNLRDEAAKRFEEFVITLIEAHCPGFVGVPETLYGPRKHRLDTPDVLLKRNGQVVAAFECKSSKMPFEAQFSDNPIVVAERGFAQMVKGIRQLWRFFANVRRGVYNLEPVAPDAYGVLLTIDDWFLIGRELLNAATVEAREQARDFPEIEEQDMREIVPCSIMDLHRLLSVSTEDQVLQTFAAGMRNDFRAHPLPEVRKSVAAIPEAEKLFPFDFGALMPWYEQLPD